MRVAALVLTAALGIAVPATAGEASGVEIVEYGLYTAEVTGQLRDSNGIISNVIENLCHIATTTTVPMRGRSISVSATASTGRCPATRCR